MKGYLSASLSFILNVKDLVFGEKGFDWWNDVEYETTYNFSN